MKKFKLRAVAWSMALLMMVSSFGHITAFAAEDEEEVLTVIDAMMDQKNNITIDEGNWDKIVVPKEVTAKNIFFEDVTTKELEVESGMDCVLQVNGGNITNVNIIPPQIEVIDYEDIVRMLAEGVPANEVAELYRNSLKEKNRCASLQPKFEVKGTATIGMIQVSGSVSLQLSENNVKEVKVKSDGTQDRLKINLKGYNGSVTVEQAESKNGTYQLLNLTLEDSNLKELNVTGEGKGSFYVEGKKNSNVQNMNVAGSAAVTMNVKADVVKVAETVKNASLKIYSVVKDVLVKASGIQISVAANAKVDNAVIEGDNVKVNASGTIGNSTITGTGSNVSNTPSTGGPSYNGGGSSSTPVVTPTPEEPTTTPKPEEPTTTPKPEEPTTTPKPEEPTTTPKPEEPTTTPKPEEPTTTPTPEEPTTTPKPEEPTTTPKPEEPTTTPTPEEPTTTPTPEEPTTTPKPEEPTTTPKPEEPTTTPTPAPEEPEEDEVAKVFAEFDYTVDENKITLTGVKTEKAALVIPTLNGYEIYAQFKLQKPSLLTSVTMASGAILGGAFADCENLTKITLQSGVTLIEENAFANIGYVVEDNTEQASPSAITTVASSGAVTTPATPSALRGTTEIFIEGDDIEIKEGAFANAKNKLVFYVTEKVAEMLEKIKGENWEIKVKESTEE